MAFSRKPGRLRLRSVTDLLAAVPYLIGFHPSHSLVLVGLDGLAVRFLARVDLPEPGDTGAVRHAVTVTARQRVSGFVAVGYGAPVPVTAALSQVRAAAEAAGIDLLDAVRVSGGRYWSVGCTEPDCCPPDGVPFEPSTTEVAAAATLAGLVALPDRASLTDQVAPVEGAPREAMRRATVAAEHQITVTLESGDAAAGRALLVARGRRLLEDAAVRYAGGGRLTDPDAAWLSLLLLFDEVLDTAWHRTGTDPARHLTLWIDLTRRAEPDLCPPVATLAAYAAWRRGDGALAGIAARRALTEAPDYRPARVVVHLLHSGVDPDDLAGHLDPPPDG